MEPTVLEPFSLGLIAAALASVVLLGAHAKADGLTTNTSQNFSWIVPALFTIALSIVTAWLFSDTDFGSPDALLSYGAHYAARSNGSEPWRFVTSFFVHDELALSLVNGLSLLWIGWHVSRAIGALGFIGALVLCQIAACLAASEVDTQALFYGAGAAVVGLSTLSLTLLGWTRIADSKKKLQKRRKTDGLKSSDVAALCATFFHTGVTLLAARENAVIGWMSLAAAAAAGFAFAVLVVILRSATRESTKTVSWAARTGVCSLIIVSLLTASRSLISPEDIVGGLQLARLKRASLMARLRELEAARASKTLSAGDFANRIHVEVLEPTEKTTNDVETLLRARSTHARWLEQERRDGAVKVLGLEVIYTVYQAKDRLLSAREQILSGEAAPELESFWRQTAPQLARLNSALYQISGKSTAQQMLVKARIAAKQDLTDLENAAVDLEIMRGELYLSELRSMALSEPTSQSSGGREPASENDWLKIGKEIESHRSRLELIATRVSHPSPRLQSLVEHLAKAQEAVKPNPQL